MKNVNLFKLVPLVFLLSWTGVVPSVLISYGYDLPDYFKHLEIMMTLGPLLATTVFIYSQNGKRGLKDFYSKLFVFRAKSFVILVAILIPIVVSALASYIGANIDGRDWLQSGNGLSVIGNGLIITIMYLILNTEELAWRGVVFDQLFEKHGFLKACLILGPVWWLFHMPLFLYANGHPAGYSLTEFSFIVITATIILGWIYVKGNRSLFYCHMHHQLMNGFAEAFPIFPIFVSMSLVPLWVFCGLLVLVAGGLVFSTIMERSN